MKKIIALLLAIALASTFTFANPGRTDSKGGHNVNTPGWGYDIGTYHYHDKKYDIIIPVAESTGRPLQIVYIEEKI